MGDGRACKWVGVDVGATGESQACKWGGCQACKWVKAARAQHEGLKVRKKEEKKNGLGHFIGIWFGPKTGGGKWANLGFNWAQIERNGLGRCHGRNG